MQTVDLRSVAENSLDTLRAAAEKKGIWLSVDFPDGAMEVEGDAALLLQMVRKLVDNALKYSRAGGQVVVRGRTEQDGAALEVEDAGIGIAEEHVPRSSRSSTWSTAAWPVGRAERAWGCTSYGRS